MPSKKPTRDQVKSFRSAVARLKEKGLVSKRVDARKQRYTKYMRGQVRKYGDVLQGKAAVVSVPKRQQAMEYETFFRRKGKKIVVPKDEGERVYWNKREQRIEGVSRKYGRKVKRHFLKLKFSSDEDLRAVAGKLPFRFYYVIRFAGGQVWRFEDVEEIIKFMSPYEDNPKNPFRNWQTFVTIEEITDDNEDDEGEGDEGE